MSSVDVVVPCYNYGRFLRHCVESVLHQADVDLRVLIIDDASSDNTPEIAGQLAREDQRVTFFRHEVNQGHVVTFNEGLQWTSSEYYLLLSADDYLTPGALGRATQLMDSHPEVGFTFGNAFELDDLNQFKHMPSVPQLSAGASQCILNVEEFIAILSVRNIVPTATAVVRTSLQRGIGGYRKELLHTGDMEMWLRLAAHSAVGVIAQPQAVYRRHSSNMSLSYTASRCFPDLRQRRLAIRYFFEGCHGSLVSPQERYREMLASLACQAVDAASAAFNDGDKQLSDQLLRFAIETFPAVKKTLAWKRVAVKRLLGLRGWHILAPAVFRLRELVIHLGSARSELCKHPSE